MSNWSQSDLIAYEMRQRHNAQRGEAKSATAVPDGQEGALHDEIKDYCHSRGWLALYSRMDKRTSRPKGEADFIIAAEGGRVIWVECKTKSTKRSDDQLAFAAQMHRLGHVVHVVRSLTEFIEATKI